MIAVISLPYGMNEATSDKYITDVVYAQLRELMPSLPENRTEASYWSEYTVDIEKLARIIQTFEVKKVIQDIGLFTMLQRVEDRLRRIHDDKANFNEKCNVHVPGFGLLAMTRLKIETDACTDNINDHMAKGWRIVAVCPQPDQRRPDYVLGRMEA